MKKCSKLLNACRKQLFFFFFKGRKAVVFWALGVESGLGEKWASRRRCLIRSPLELLRQNPKMSSCKGRLRVCRSGQGCEELCE